ncbi:hypothetical protein AMECASPLE_031592 [Ameca splendens]|uniref:Uncharacterized protein n=1 Tax=Ameca splendens TaxID=208324 RepID=A0ABV0XJ96_9TELE
MFRPLLENQGCSSSDRQAPYNPTISRSASWSSSLGDGSASEDSDTETEQQSSQSTQREHSNSMQKDPPPGVEPRTFLLQGNSATNYSTMQPFY